MSLRLKIEENYKNAIKNKNNNEINTLRLIKSAIKDKDIESRAKNKEEGISESEIMSLLQKLNNAKIQLILLSKPQEMI